MRLTSLMALVAVVAATVVTGVSTGMYTAIVPAHAAAVAAQDGESADLPERDEVRRSVDLRPGAEVTVTGINGEVTAETSSSDTAEILVVRSARTRDELSTHKVTIDASPTSLVIKGDEERSHGRDNVRQRVVLKLPRSISLVIRGVNGRVRVGEIDGTVHVSGINGAVDVAHASSTSDISGINGRVRLSLDHLEADGLKVSGVNGKVEIRFSETIDADISVTGINGSVFNDSGKITVLGKMNPSSFRGQIGRGGPLIRISGVNGNVELLNQGSFDR